MLNARLDKLRVGGLTLMGVSRGGVETCLMVPELSIMFDVGMCPPGSLKYSTILASHGHADHLGGLHYFVSHRQLLGLPAATVHGPREMTEPLTRIFELWSGIEGYELNVNLKGYAPGDSVDIDGRFRAHAIRTAHPIPSLAWLVERRVNKLKPEFRSAQDQQLAELRRRGVTLTDTKYVPTLCVTGDTMIDTFDREPALRTCRVLVHELTSFDDRRNVEVTRGFGHTHLRELCERAERFEGEALVLVHRSPRHSRGEAEHIVRTQFPASVLDRVHVFGR